MQVKQEKLISFINEQKTPDEIEVEISKLIPIIKSIIIGADPLLLLGRAYFH